MTSFLTSSAEDLFSTLKPSFRDVLEHANEHRFEKAISRVQDLREVCQAAVRDAQDDDSSLRDLYALARYIDLLESYAMLWKRILSKSFAKSWTSLQNALDQLRIIKKFSMLDVSFFEDQLMELEKAYPYKVFMSIGAIVDHFECSICGLDIDGQECSHRRGELYMGSLACGIAREITLLDHVSFVLDPEDKRCVVTLTDEPLQFPVVDYISELLGSGQMKIGSFARLEWSKRGEKDHVDVIAEKTGMQRAVV